MRESGLPGAIPKVRTSLPPVDSWRCKEKTSEFIPKQLEELVSVSVGQPPLFVPPASLNFSSLTASASASLDKNRGASLTSSRFFKSFLYIGAKACKLQKPKREIPQPKARALARAAPTRIPVNDPGPWPTA